MKKFIFFILILVSLSLAQSNKWQSQIDKINKAMTESVMSNTPEATLVYYADDAISLPSYEPMIVGKKAMEKFTDENQSDEVRWLSFDLTTKYVWESGDFVIEIGSYEYSMEIKAMAHPFKDVGKYMTVYEIQDDNTLKIKAETWNTDSNPWAMMAPQPPSPDEEAPPPPLKKE